MQKINTLAFEVRLRNVSILDVLQLKCLVHATCTMLVLREDRLFGEIHLRDGNICSATLGPQAGQAALNEILTWKIGSIHEVDLAPDVVDTIATQSWQALLLRAVHEQDNTHAGLDQCLNPPSAPSSADFPFPFELPMGTGSIEDAELVLADQEGEIVAQHQAADAERYSLLLTLVTQDLRPCSTGLNLGAGQRIDFTGAHGCTVLGLRPCHTWLIHSETPNVDPRQLERHATLQLARGVLGVSHP